MQIIVLGLVAAVSALPNPSVQTAYGYGQGGSYVLSSSVACLPGDPCVRPPLPTRPVGGDPFRSEFRHHAKANKRSADPSVQTCQGQLMPNLPMVATTHKSERPLKRQEKQEPAYFDTWSYVLA